MGALAHTLWQIEIPLGRFYPNHPGARGQHPLGALARTLWQVKSPQVILSESPRGSGATVGDLILGYPMRGS